MDSPFPLQTLIITPQLPYPPHQGTSLRNYHIVQGLAATEEITLLSLATPNQTSLGPLADWCHAVRTAPAPTRTPRQRLGQLLFSRQPDMAHRLRAPALEAALSDLLTRRRYEVVQLEGLELAYLLPVVRRLAPHSRVVLDNHNVETALQQRIFETDRRRPTRWPAAVYSWMQIGRLRRYETWACRAADLVVVVSQADATALRQLVGPPRPPVRVLPNCLDVQAWQRPASQAAEATLGRPYDIVFTGKMDFRPNVDAALWFGEAIWPLIRRACPEATAAFVGQQPHARLAPLQQAPGLTLTGAVEDVRPYLAGARVVILPLRMGSGTRLKLIEAFAAGKAVVSTTLGAEGYPVVSGEHLLLADEAEAFAAAVVQLWNQPDRRQRLGQAGRALAQAYDWRVIIPQLATWQRQLVAGRIADETEI